MPDLRLTPLVAVKMMIFLAVLGLNHCSGSEETGTPSATAPPATGCLLWWLGQPFACVLW